MVTALCRPRRAVSRRFPTRDVGPPLQQDQSCELQLTRQLIPDFFYTSAEVPQVPQVYFNLRSFAKVLPLKEMWSFCIWRRLEAVESAPLVVVPRQHFRTGGCEAEVLMETFVDRTRK